jgi:hypothetical protein
MCRRSREQIILPSFKSSKSDLHARYGLLGAFKTSPGIRLTMKKCDEDAFWQTRRLRHLVFLLGFILIERIRGLTHRAVRLAQVHAQSLSAPAQAKSRRRNASDAHSRNKPEHKLYTQNCPLFQMF